MTDAITLARQRIFERYRPDGFNIGINVGAAAGQTVFHLHVHVIPRYFGDVEDPRGGVRNVIPGLGNYLAGPGQDFSDQTGEKAESYLRLGRFGGDRIHLFAGGETQPLLRPLLDDMDRARQIDIAVAFVLRTGIELVEPHLREALERAVHVRFLTGDYLDSTDPDALRRLLDLDGPIERRVFETNGKQSFHPKAYIFTRADGGGVAYIGSSNLSRPALTHGIEWNYRLTSAEDPRGFAEIVAAFTRLFHHPATRPLDPEWIGRYASRRVPPRPGSGAEVVPEPAPVAPEPTEVQKEALSALERTRLDGNAAGLVVLGTGMGKTYLAALDSARPEFRRVLFVAHREEILAQAVRTFRMKRHDARFGHYTGTGKEPAADVLFASIQTLGRTRHLERFERDAFDYIVVDEFHHASAATYRRLIDYFRPKFLLGLTATPERTDGGDLLALCGENLVYRCDFLDGIRRGLLCPFHDFGVPDEVDYANIPWRNSRFDVEELTNAVATRTRAQNALEQYRDKAGRRTLAFCCSTRHAEFMAEFFRHEGIRVAAVHSAPGSAPRAASLEKLRDGDLDVIFAVDMFNEGVDVPAIDTVMMLRPTESAILWLQQFGRGLRLAEGKDHLRVIDYIGNHRTFLVKPRTLFQLPGTGDAAIARVLEQLQAGEVDLPPGCAVTYDLRTVDIMRGLLRVRGGIDALRLYYEDFRERHGRRPRAIEAYHDGCVPRAARKTHGSWVRFVEAMGDLSAEERAVLPVYGKFLGTLEITPMTRSYKMLVLLGMLDEDAFPGAIAIDRLADRFAELARRSAKLRAEVGRTLENGSELLELIRKNPIAAWCDAKGTGGTRYFAFDRDTFSTLKPIEPELRVALQQLTREIAEWRLAEYLMRGGDDESPPSGRIICNVSHSGGRPILFLPDRNRVPGIPEGSTNMVIDGDSYEVNVGKVEINTARRPGSARNELPILLRRWFGPSAGRPGTGFKVAIELSDTGYVMAPCERTDNRSKPELRCRPR